MYCFWSFENISRGGCVRVVFLIFRRLAGLVVVMIVGVCVPKAIPHLFVLLMVRKHTPMYYLRLISTKMYVSYLSTSPIQSK